jgi:hypothetical protein
MGAVTVVIDPQKSRKDVGYVVADVTFSGTYGAGGDTYTDKQFQMLRVDAIVPQGVVASATTSFDLEPDLANRKLRLMGGAASGVALAESAVGNQAATVARVIVFGIPAV